jgi:hypothetical protein
MIRLALVVFALVIGVIFASVQTTSTEKHDEVEMSLKDYLLRSFIDELPQINAGLPLQLDADTVLLSVEYIDSRVVSRYLLTNYNLDASSDLFIRDQMIPALKKEACLDEVKRSLIESDVEFLMIYQDRDKSQIFEILLNREICTRAMKDSEFLRN